MKNIYLVILFLLTACSGDDSDDSENATTVVLINGSNVNCGSGVGFGIEQSELDLTSAGIDVISSVCGFAVDDQGARSCDPFDTIYSHEVQVENVVDAQALGYITVDELDEDFQLEFMAVDGCL